MTKLQALIAEIEALPLEEQRVLVSMVAHLTPSEDDIFELTEDEIAELDRRMKNVDSEASYTHEESMQLLRAKYATDIGA